MGIQRDDPQRVGHIELTDALRWVPSEGQDWSVPLGEVTVRTRRRFLGYPHGIEVRIAGLGVARMRPQRSARRLLRELIDRGAKYEPAG